LRCRGVLKNPTDRQVCQWSSGFCLLTGVVRRVVRFCQFDYFIPQNSLVIRVLAVGSTTLPQNRFTHIYKLFTHTGRLLSNNSRLGFLKCTLHTHFQLLNRRFILFFLLTACALLTAFGVNNVYLSLKKSLILLFELQILLLQRLQFYHIGIFLQNLNILILRVFLNNNQPSPLNDFHLSYFLI